MQKNKIGVVKAVCNNAVKKLVAICLAMAVGGTVVIDGNYGFVANAQDQEQMERDHLHAKLLNLENFRPVGTLHRISRILMGQLESGAVPLEEIRSNTEKLELFTILHGVYVYGEEDINSEEYTDSEEDSNRDCCLNACGLGTMWDGIGSFFEALGDGVRDLFAMVRGRGHNNALDGIQRGNHITAGANSHVHSVSDHDLTHEGAGAALITGTGPVDIDEGEITISECNEDFSRNVTVNSANSLTIAPHVNVNLRNGTAFETGETAPETLRNLVRTMSPQTVSQVMREFSGQN